MFKARFRPKKTAEHGRISARKIRPEPRQVRTPKNPVRVVFVCPEGKTSGTLANLFSQWLENKRISAISASSTQLRGEIRPIFTGRKLIGEKEIRAALAKADIISHSINTPGSLSRLRELAPGCIITGPSYYSIGRNFAPLLKLIKEKFEIKN